MYAMLAYSTYSHRCTILSIIHLYTASIEDRKDR